ncbi:hypothetical protein [Achromobacter aloeverae]|nr:hypothetical protein [Achromobacter aloeverae]
MPSLSSSAASSLSSVSTDYLSFISSSDAGTTSPHDGVSRGSAARITLPKIAAGRRGTAARTSHRRRSERRFRDDVRQAYAQPATSAHSRPPRTRPYPPGHNPFHSDSDEDLPQPARIAAPAINDLRKRVAPDGRLPESGLQASRFRENAAEQDSGYSAPSTPRVMTGSNASLAVAEASPLGKAWPDRYPDGMPAAEPLDAVRDNWTMLHRLLNGTMVSTATEEWIAKETPYRCRALYDSLMRGAEHDSRSSVTPVAKSLAALMETAGPVDYSTLRKAMLDDTLTPLLHQADPACLRVLAHLEQPWQAVRKDILQAVDKRLGASRVFAKARKNGGAASGEAVGGPPDIIGVARGLAGELLDAIGAKCREIVVQQQWNGNVALATDAFFTLASAETTASGTAAASSQRHMATQLIRALRELQVVSQALDVDKSVKDRLDGLLAGLPPQRRSLLVAALDRHAADFDRTIDRELPIYESDLRMRGQMRAFIGQLRQAVSSGATAMDEGLYQSYPESTRHRSWAPVRLVSRLWRRLFGYKRNAPTQAMRDIKALAYGLAHGKQISPELVERLAIEDAVFTPGSAQGVAARGYLRRTLGKLTPQEAVALRVASANGQSVEALARMPALRAELDAALAREWHIRKLAHQVREIGAALRLGRGSKRKRLARAQALVAALDVFADAMAEVPNHLRAFELLQTAMLRETAADGRQRTTLGKARRLATAVADIEEKSGLASGYSKAARIAQLDIVAQAIDLMQQTFYTEGRGGIAVRALPTAQAMD